LQPLLILVLVSLVQVRGTIEKELGKSMSDLFADFVLDPLATASVSTLVSK
jgi:predicted unusual protein kinase regulating ubiquinone biosynthesis (AarF/ABC1/UbiB family)